MATHSSIDRNILRTEEPGWSIGSGRVGTTGVTEHAHRRKELWRARGPTTTVSPEREGLWRARGHDCEPGLVGTGCALAREEEEEEEAVWEKGQETRAWTGCLRVCLWSTQSYQASSQRRGSDLENKEGRHRSAWCLVVKTTGARTCPSQAGGGERQEQSPWE